MTRYASASSRTAAGSRSASGASRNGRPCSVRRSAVSATRYSPVRAAPDAQRAAADDRERDVDDEPVRPQRRDELRGLGVEHGDGEPEREQHRQHDEQPEPAHVAAQRDDEERGADGQRARGGELVHVAPRRPAHGQPAQQHGAAEQQRREPGQGHRDVAGPPPRRQRRELGCPGAGHGGPGHGGHRPGLRPGGRPHGPSGGGRLQVAAATGRQRGRETDQRERIDRHRAVDEQVARLCERLVHRHVVLLLTPRPGRPPGPDGAPGAPRPARRPRPRPRRARCGSGPRPRPR